MKRSILVLALCVGAAVLIAGRMSQLLRVHAQSSPDWPQWGRNSRHNGSTPAVGQNPNTKLGDVTFDPFASQEEQANGGELLVHYQAPLVDGNSVFLEFKSGTYNPNNWNTQIWNERAFTWQGGSLVQQWNFQSDWKPEESSGLGGWEPVFHAALSHGFVYVPGASGSIYKVNESDGSQVAHYIPFGNDATTYVAGPITVDARGNAFYNVFALNASNPWDTDVRGAWLVRVTPQGAVRKISYAKLVPDAPTNCGGSPCGSQRPGVNTAPALSPDGQTVYTVSRAHFGGDVAYMVAANLNLTPKWDTAMNNGAYVSNIASSTPSVAPDGAVLYGAASVNTSRGVLLKFDSAGHFLTTYDFGWDETPAIYAHDGTYSVILKDNHYDGGGPYYMTQLNANLVVEWQYKVPSNREWCVNAPAVDANGTVYANSEDGNVYVINQGGTLKGKLFLRRALGAAYTPIAIGRDGKIYTENDGDMFVIGN